MENYGRSCFLLFVKNWHFSKARKFLLLAMFLNTSGRRLSIHSSNKISSNGYGNFKFFFAFASFCRFEGQVLYIWSISRRVRPKNRYLLGTNLKNLFSCRLSKNKSFFSLNLILSSLLKISTLQVGKSVHSNVLIIACSFQNYDELPGYGYSCWLLIYCERAAIGNLKLFKVTTKYRYGFDFTIHLCDHNSATVANL